MTLSDKDARRYSENPFQLDRKILTPEERIADRIRGEAGGEFQRSGNPLVLSYAEAQIESANEDATDPNQLDFIWS